MRRYHEDCELTMELLEDLCTYMDDDKACDDGAYCLDAPELHLLSFVDQVGVQGTQNMKLCNSLASSFRENL